MKKIWFLILIGLMNAFFTSAWALGQTYSVAGKLTDSVSAHGLQGVTITIATKTSITDVNGDYIINDVPNGTQTISGTLANYTIVDKTVAIISDMTGQDLTGIGDNRPLS